MLTSKHHNLNKLVWRYGLTSAAAVLLAFGGGASSVKAEGMTSGERTQKINEIKEFIKKSQKQIRRNFGTDHGMVATTLKTKTIRRN